MYAGYQKSIDFGLYFLAQIETDTSNKISSMKIVYFGNFLLIVKCVDTIEYGAKPFKVSVINAL